MFQRRSLIIFFIDSLLLVCAAVPLALFSKRYGLPDAVNQGYLSFHLLLLFACSFVFQGLFRNYSSIWRYAESREYLNLVVAVLCGFCAYELIARLFINQKVISFVLLTAIACLWLLGMLAVRFCWRSYLGRRAPHSKETKIPVAIVGAGNAGFRLLTELQNSPRSRYSVKCFFDDDPRKIHRRIQGVEIKGSIRDIPTQIQKLKIRELIVAIPSLDETCRQEILNELSRLNNITVTVLPSGIEFLENKSMSSQLRPVQIEDLLGRKSVHLDQAVVNDFLHDKVVLVTGGGGSIGSELCRQIAKIQPRQLIISDIYENNAYDIQQELRGHYGSKLNLAVEIASIRDRCRMEQLFAQYRPQVVFHAAAHKHVPLMENNPQEAVRNNVFGTLNLVQVADAYGVDKFVLISTDKAVNPTSVMGASKRMCEIILQSMKGRSSTCFAAVRFGNVLGSNGSVIPLFKRQIENGGPVTITDKRIIRYFMTISEAAELVLQAGAMAQQNELYVLDMGEPVKILNLAEDLIRLSGLVPYQDIPIIETGLRPGEKLYEELLVANRDIEKTENEKIFVEHQPMISPDELETKLRILQAALDENTPDAVRNALHKVVPNYYTPDEFNRSHGSEVKIPAIESSI